MAFKGSLPSTLWQHYNQEGGKYLMELDLSIALDISDKINHATSQVSKKSSTGLTPLSGNDAHNVVNRRNQRREIRKRQQGLNDT